MSTMNTGKRVLGALILASAVTGAYAQTSTATPAQKTAKAKHKTQEQVLLEQLNEKYEKLEQLNQQKYQGLEQEVQDLKRQLQTANQNAAAAQAAAAEAKQAGDKAIAASSSEQPWVANLQSSVADLKASSSSMALTVEADHKTAQALEHPETIPFMGVTLKPGGFVAAETVSRQRAIGGDVNTQFSGIPFAGQTAGVLSEFNASGRQSRISLLSEGKIPGAKLRGYYEADFLSAGTTSNDNQSNSYTLRQRQVWAQAALDRGFIITGGQMWSLATEYRSGLDNLHEWTPLTIDPQYNVGYTWARQYGFRVVKSITPRLWLGGSVEESQTLNIGGHNLPTIVYQTAGNGSGLYNPTANYSINYAPDLLAKVAYDPGLRHLDGHFELFAVGRFFRDRAFPNAQLTTGASALGAFTSKTTGGGVGANARVSLLAKKLDIGAHILAGDGIGRYSTSTLADATAHPDGSLELLSGGSALGRVEWHATPRLDVYGYYGGEYVKRAYYANGLFVTTAGPTFGQPILVGYGAPNNIVSGCYTEVLPVTSPNGGGDVPGTAANCAADNRNIQEGTAGYWYRFYKGTHGTLQQGIQYSYVERHTWQGIGNPLTGLGGSPKAIDNMWFTSFRYYLPQ
jgi:hypothetical protein